MSGALRQKLTENSQAIAAQVHCYTSTSWKTLRQEENMPSPSNISRKYALGIDLGFGSLGWALIGLDDSDQAMCLIRAGVRIFKPGVDGTALEIEEGEDKPKAIVRRLARHSRRQRRRHAYRQLQLFGLLQQQGLLPKADVEDAKSPSQERHRILNLLDLDISRKWSAISIGTDFSLLPLYRLRKSALEEKLEPYEIGRILYHLSQRRGFKSNRSDRDSEADDEISLVKSEIAELSRKIAITGARTLGEYLAGLDPHQIGQNVRRRKTAREMYEEEFDLIWKKQSTYYSQLLTESLRKEINSLLFFQRPITAQARRDGDCLLEGKGHRRAAWATLEAQRFRLLEKINCLKIIDKANPTGRLLLTSERKLVFNLLDREGGHTFADLRKALKLEKETEFNLELRGQTRILGNSTNEVMLSAFGKSWDLFSEDTMKLIVEEWRTTPSVRGLVRRGIEHWGLDQDAAQKWAGSIPEHGFCLLSRKALRRLIPAMLEGMPFREARIQEYGIYSGRTPALDQLPPLQVHRKIPNSTASDKFLRDSKLGTIGAPAIERALVELRKVVNAIVRQHGKPYEVHVELSRGLKSTREERQKIAKRIRERKKKHDHVKAILQSEFRIAKPSDLDIEKMLLHTECGGICPYTGRAITLSDLFVHSSDFIVEHIIPLCRYPDDSFQNKTLCWREESVIKGNKTPFEAYAQDPTRWCEIQSRIQAWRPRNPRKLRRFMQPHGKELRDFLAEQMTDNRYASTLTCRFLGALFGGSTVQIAREARRVIFASSGALTSTLRRAWGLESILRETTFPIGESVRRTPRADHRYHAIDAITIALTRRAVEQSLADSSALDAISDLRSLSPRICQSPWGNFLDSVRPHIKSIVVSHRPEHKMSGALHDITNYGQPFSCDGKTMVHVRKPVPTLSSKDISSIVDPAVRLAVQRKAETLNGDLTICALTNNWPTLATKAGFVVPIKRVRLRKVVNITSISNEERQRYVAATKGHHTEIYSMMRDDQEIKWEGVPVTLFEASERRRKGDSIIRHEHPRGGPWRFKFSLMGGDTIELHRRCIHDANICVPEIYQIRAIVHNGQLSLVKVDDARSIKDIKASKEWWSPRAEALRKLGCRKVSIDTLGRVCTAND